ncbi:DUF397 domain-containing protein [Lentzea flava]|uniref:DUF397 domain-containing protein n=1 Tax=Lentzea flava TaxID=103732 RepID=A0ABQ2UEH8_9PSEU|nr:DUF397 domain-containing protein [Lentzea flava]MCP2198564.1 protein of unknown function (DUF397) [Lentzea flava]GGU26740.1 hypothetical protein GCM10010178_18940 [Lentzea flava]
MMSISPVHSQFFAERQWKSACGPNGGNCVEVNLGVPGVVGVRDSKSSSPELLIFMSAGWTAFADALRRGRYDVD